MDKRLKHNGEFVTVNQHKIHLYRQGNINNPKLVFMSDSGTVAPVYDFKILYDKLISKYRIIVIEKFGYGYSDIFESFGDIDSCSFSEIMSKKAQKTALKKTCRDMVKNSGITGEMAVFEKEKLRLLSIILRKQEQLFFDGF